MGHFTLRCEVEWRLGIIGNAILESSIGRDIHIAGVGNLHAINYETVFEGLKQVFAHLHTPHAIAVALHSHILRQNLALKFHLLSIGSLKAEDNTILGIIRRDNWTWKEACHHAWGELLFLTSSSGSRLSVLHGLIGCFLIEEQRQGLSEEVLGIHPCMSELIVGKLLHTADALVVEELHIVASITIQEVIGTHAQPEQTNLLVGIIGIIVNTGNIGRRERTVAAQIRELIEVAQAIEQSLITTARETADGTMVLIINGTIVLFYIRHQVVNQILTEHIATEAGLRSTVSIGSCQQLCRITVWQHNNHLLGLLLCQQIVEDIVYTSHLIINFFSICCSTNQIEHRILLIEVHHVVWWQVYNRVISSTQTL